MKILVSFLVVLFVLVSSAVMADRPAMRAALGGLLGNSSTDTKKSGNPSAQRIYAPIPIALAKFSERVRIFPLVTVIDGDAKDQARATSALRSELQKVAFRCNFSVVTGVKPPAGSLTFSLTVVKDHGQSVSNESRSDSESSGGSSYYRRRGSSSSRSESSSSSNSGESTFVGTSVSGGLDLNEVDGSTEGLAFVDNVFSGNSERTASSYSDSRSNSYDYSSRRSGSYGSDQSSSSSSSFRGDPEYSKSQSSRVTISEAVEKAVYCILSQGIDYFNVTHGAKSGAVPTTEEPRMASGYSGDVKYIAVDE